MDINLIREAFTLLAIVAFAGIVWWAYAPSRKGAWEEKGELDE
jgi:cbb3-type cytochrome oxidase subunit 3